MTATEARCLGRWQPQGIAEIETRHFGGLLTAACSNPDCLATVTRPRSQMPHEPCCSLPCARVMQTLRWRRRLP